MLNILEEPMIRYRNHQGQAGLATLPGVYSLLQQDEVETFPALRAHQRHSWHALLVQLGALALHQDGATQLPQDPKGWRELLRGLTPDFPDDSPWHLSVEDTSLPAFLQPPATAAGALAQYRFQHPTPDSIDILTTSKNHHVKRGVAQQAQPDDWVMALATAQTMSGYEAPGMYGISRMNRGHSSRPAFSLAPAHGGQGAHCMRDIIALLEGRPLMLQRYPRVNGPHSLLWTLPWDGAREQMLQPEDLDPFYIDCARRIRLLQDPGGRLRAVRASSKTYRVEIEKTRGRTGDPWVPTDLARDGIPLTLGDQGFNYERITQCFTGENWQHPILLRPTLQEQQEGTSMQLVARCLVRGEGGTNGYSEQHIPLREALITTLHDSQASQEAGEIARERLAHVRTARGILQTAILIFMTHANRDVSRRDNVPKDARDRADLWLRHLDHRVEQTFLDDLQTELEAPAEQRDQVRRRWLINGEDGLVDQALELLAQGQEALSCTRNRFYAAQAQSDMVFQQRLRASRGFPFLFQPAQAEQPEPGSEEQQTKPQPDGGNQPAPQ